MLIRSVLINWRPVLFIFEFKVTPSQEEHKTIFRGSKINEMALSDQIDFPSFLRLRKITYRNFINSGMQESAAPLYHKMAFATKF